MNVTPDNSDMSASVEYNVKSDLFQRKIPRDSKDAVKKRLFMTGKTEPYQWAYERPVQDCLIIDEKQTEEKSSDTNEQAGEKHTEVRDRDNVNDRYVIINIS